MRVKERVNESQNKEEIVDFLHIDTSKITLQNQSQISTMERRLEYYTMEGHYLLNMKDILPLD